MQLINSLVVLGALAIPALANNAVQVNNAYVNGYSAQEALTDHGSDWYFTVCACMTVAMLSFAGLAMTKPRQHRIFHYITAGVVMVAAIAYFTMGSHLGFVPINVEFHRSDPVVRGNNREIYYVRYVDWAITTPLLLLDLLLTAGLPWPTIVWTILVDEVMVVTGLVGALVASSYKFGYFVFGTIALFFILYVLVFEARVNANKIGKDVGRTYLICGALTSFLWTLYPIAWGLCEGGNVISVDSEAIFYGILDLLAKPVFGALLIWGHRNIDPATLGLVIHDYTAEDGVHHEKRGINGTNGATNGVTNGTHTATTTTTDGGVETV